MFFSSIGSYKTYVNCLKDLEAWGLIKQTNFAKNQYQSRQISLYTEKWTAFSAKANCLQLPRQEQSTAMAMDSADTHADTSAGLTHCPGTDPSTGIANAPYKTLKLVKEETSKLVNEQTLKEEYGVGQSKSSADKRLDETVIHFSISKELVNDSSNERASPKEKKNVAPKRNESSAKLNDNSTKLKESWATLNENPARPIDNWTKPTENVEKNTYHSAEPNIAKQTESLSNQADDSSSFTNQQANRGQHTLPPTACVIASPESLLSEDRLGEDRREARPVRKGKQQRAALKPDQLFSDSLYVDKPLFLQAFAGSDYEGANLEYYYEIVKNWSESKQARKKDWIATVKNWMLRDFKEGKLVTYSQPIHEPASYGKSTTRNAAAQNSYSVLGAAVDAYFERKYGK